MDLSLACSSADNRPWHQSRHFEHNNAGFPNLLVMFVVITFITVSCRRPALQRCSVRQLFCFQRGTSARRKERITPSRLMHWRYWSQIVCHWNLSLYLFADWVFGAYHGDSGAGRARLWCCWLDVLTANWRQDIDTVRTRPLRLDGGSSVQDSL